MNSAFTRRVFTMVTALAAVILVGGAAAVAAAQSGRSLSGIVRDIMGRPMAGVEVQLTTASGTVLKATTTPDGKYEFPGLGPGTYDFMVKQSGFKTDRSPLFFDGRSSVERNVKLSVGSLSEELTVMSSTAGSPAASTATGGRASAAGESPAPCTAKAGGGDIVAPKKVVHVRPTYPLDLAAAGVSGPVVLAGIVTKQGGVDSIRVLSGADEGLATAATAAMKQWQYTPTLLNCAPIEVELTVTVNFTIPK